MPSRLAWFYRFVPPRPHRQGPAPTMPSGMITINGNSTLKGRVAADRLTLNGNSLLADPAQP
jgi:hypothetical protein